MAEQTRHTPPASAPAKRRSRAVRIVRACFVIMLAIALLAVGTVALMRSPVGDRLLTRYLPGLIDPMLERVGLGIHYGGLEGPLPERIRIDGLRLEDMHGVWLEADAVELRLNIWSILRGHIDVTSAVAERVRFLRVPEFPSAETATEPSPPGPLALFPSFLTLEAPDVALREVFLGPRAIGLPGLPGTSGGYGGQEKQNEQIGQIGQIEMGELAHRAGPAEPSKNPAHPASPDVPVSPDGPGMPNGPGVPVFDATGSVRLAARDAEVRLALEWLHVWPASHSPQTFIEASYKGTTAAARVRGELIPAASPYLAAYVPALSGLAFARADIDASADMPRIPPAPDSPFDLAVRGWLLAAPVASTPADLRTQRLTLAGGAIWNGDIWDIREARLEYGPDALTDIPAPATETALAGDWQPVLALLMQGKANQRTGDFDLETDTTLSDSKALMHNITAMYQIQALDDLAAMELPSGGMHLAGRGSMSGMDGEAPPGVPTTQAALVEPVGTATPDRNDQDKAARSLALDASVNFFSLAWPWEQAQRLAGDAPTISARANATRRDDGWFVQIDHLDVQGSTLRAGAQGELAVPLDVALTPPDPESPSPDGIAMPAGNATPAARRPSDKLIEAGNETGPQPGAVTHGLLELDIALDDIGAVAPGATGRANVTVSARGGLYGEPLILTVNGESPKLTLSTGPTREVEGLRLAGGGVVRLRPEPELSSFGVELRLSADQVEGAPVSATVSAASQDGAIEAEVQASLFGLDAEGHITAHDKAGTWAIAGSLDAGVSNWDTISGFAGMPVSAHDTRLHAEAEHTGGRQQLRATLRGVNLSLPDAGSASVESLAAEANIDDAFGTPQIEVTATGGRGSASGFDWSAVQAHVRMQDGHGLDFTIDVEGKNEAGASGRYDLQASALRLDTLHMENEAQGTGLRLVSPATIAFTDGLVIDRLEAEVVPSGRLEGRVRLTPALVDIEVHAQDVALAVARLFSPSVPEGRLSGEVSLRGAPQSPSGSFSLDVVDVQMSTGDFGPTGRTSAFAARAGAGSNDPGPRGTASSDMPKLSGHVEGELRSGMLAATARLEAPNVQAATAQLNVPVRFGQGSMPVPEIAPGGRLSGSLDWKGQIGQLWQFVPLPGSMLTGLALVHADLEGTVQSPQYKAEAYLADGRYEDMVNGFVLEQIALEATYSSDGSSTVRLRAHDGSDGMLAASGDIAPAPAGSASAPRLRVNGVADALKPMRRDDLEFSLTGDFAIEGALTSPSITANLVIDEGAYQVIGSLGGTVTTLEVEDAASGASCDIPLPPKPEKPASVNVARQADPDASAAPALAQLQEKTEEAHDETPKPVETQAGADPQIAAEAERARSVDNDGREGLTGQTSAGSAATAEAVRVPDGIGQLDVQIRAENRVFVRARGLTSEWRADLRLRGPLNAPVLVGTLEPLRGTFELLTRDFELEEGRVIFTGPFPPNPVLNLPMVYEGPNLRAIATATGTARAPKIVLTSEPALPQDEIIAQVLFGKNFSQLSRMETLQAAKAAVELAQLARGGLQEVGLLGTLREKLGLEVLRFGSTTTGSAERKAGRDASVGSRDVGDQSTASTLEAGKYVSEDVYVGVEQGAEAGTTAVRVEIDLRPNVSVDGRSSNESSSVGLNWKKDY